MASGVQWFEGAAKDLLNETWLREALLAECDPRVAQARAAAPRETGAGAASIRAEALQGSDGWECHVSWDQDHSYMRFQHSHALQAAFGGE